MANRPLTTNRGKRYRLAGSAVQDPITDLPGVRGGRQAGAEVMAPWVKAAAAIVCWYSSSYLHSLELFSALSLHANVPLLLAGSCAVQLVVSALATSATLPFRPGEPGTLWQARTWCLGSLRFFVAMGMTAACAGIPMALAQSTRAVEAPIAMLIAAILRREVTLPWDAAAPVLSALGVAVIVWRSFSAAVALGLMSSVCAALLRLLTSGQNLLDARPPEVRVEIAAAALGALVLPLVALLSPLPGTLDVSFYAFASASAAAGVLSFVSAESSLWVDTSLAAATRAFERPLLVTVAATVGGWTRQLAVGSALLFAGAASLVVALTGKAMRMWGIDTPRGLSVAAVAVALLCVAALMAIQPAGSADPMSFSTVDRLSLACIGRDKIFLAVCSGMFSRAALDANMTLRVATVKDHVGNDEFDLVAVEGRSLSDIRAVLLARSARPDTVFLFGGGIVSDDIEWASPDHGAELRRLVASGNVSHAMLDAVALHGGVRGPLSASATGVAAVLGDPRVLAADYVNATRDAIDSIRGNGARLPIAVVLPRWSQEAARSDTERSIDAELNVLEAVTVAIAMRKFPVVVVQPSANKSDVETARAMVERAAFQLEPEQEKLVHGLFGPTLGDLLGVIRGVGAVVSLDEAAALLASAERKPFVSYTRELAHFDWAMAANVTVAVRHVDSLTLTTAMDAVKQAQPKDTREGAARGFAAAAAAFLAAARRGRHAGD